MPTISQLLRKRDAIAAELKVRQSSADEYRKLLESVEFELFTRMRTLAAAIDGPSEFDEESEPAADTEAVTTGHVDLPLEPMPPRRRLLWTAKRESLGPHVAAVLRDAGKPLNRNEIYDELMRRGVEVKGKDPKANLSAHLSYSQDVQKTDDGRWVHHDWADPAKRRPFAAASSGTTSVIGELGETVDSEQGVGPAQDTSDFA